MILLEVKNLSASYGKLQILHEVHLEVNTGEIVLVIGRNGSGKSTLLKCIAGLIKKDSGQIMFKGNKMTFVPQGRRVFNSMTVEENLEMGGYKLSSKLKAQSAKLEVFEQFPILEQKRKQRANLLSGGQQQILSIARGLMIEPELLILDEPSLGLDSKAADYVCVKIKELNKRGIAILLVEQNVKEALKFANRVYELENGKIKSK